MICCYWNIQKGKSKTTDNIELETVYTYTNKSYTGNIDNWLGNTNNGEAYLQSSLNEFKEGELVFYSYQGATPDNDELIKRTANVTI